MKTRLPRNPGPPLGFRLLGLGHWLLPHCLFYPIVKGGTIIAVLRMRKERRASRQYLRIVLGHEPRFSEILEHFYTQVRFLIDKIVLKNAADTIPTPASDPDTQEFLQLAQSGEQTLFGTFHVGHSDIIGAALATLGHKVHMVRLQVRNAYDLTVLKRVAGPALQFAWVNNPADVPFTINRLLHEGASLAMQCDRIEYGARHHAFRFLGAQRQFPVTIYYLSYLFQLPVGFAFSVPGADGSPAVISSGVYRPYPNQRKRSLQEGYAHFQRTLDLIEAHLYRHPYLWFNFLPLNPEQLPAGSTHATHRRAHATPQVLAAEHHSDHNA